MRRVTQDPIAFAIIVVLGIVFWQAWKYVTSYMGPEEGAELDAAKRLFGVFLMLLAVGIGLRMGIKAVFGA